MKYALRLLFVMNVVLFAGCGNELTTAPIQPKPAPVPTHGGQIVELLGTPAPRMTLAYAEVVMDWQHRRAAVYLLTPDGEPYDSRVAGLLLLIHLPADQNNEGKGHNSVLAQLDTPDGQEFSTYPFEGKLVGLKELSSLKEAINDRQELWGLLTVAFGDEDRANALFKLESFDEMH